MSYHCKHGKATSEEHPNQVDCRTMTAFTRRSAKLRGGKR
jgi:hypothetical protein